VLLQEDWWRIHRELIASFKTGDADLALSLYDEAKAKGYQEKRYITKNVYNAVMNLCANSDRVATGMQVLADMGGRNRSLNNSCLLCRRISFTSLEQMLAIPRRKTAILFSFARKLPGVQARRPLS
jgi:pentatricopeptide repeat protein